ncbi:MAG: peptide chain release factor N(5)-glutamine methyltransferase [Tepidanaerobacteraceae bacterium]|jgi:release factor glutamine methyltransferase|nr:peptide chain release factor N(5)-glutamine methyltransferase [Tepidanaerobacteraceae bacterium]
MNVREALGMARKRLIKAGAGNPALDAEILLAHALSVDRLRLLVNDGEKLSDEDMKCFARLLDLRCGHMPTAYITGHKEFFGIDISVGPGVLIPRPETEFAVEESLRVTKNLKKPRAVDLCCGSGAIAVAVAVNHPDAIVYASDISEIAGKYTKDNALKHHVENRVFFIKGDLWHPFEEKNIGRFDLIVSNPPYIPEGEIKNLSEDIKKEPEIALNGGIDGLDYYKRIISKAPQFLKSGGHIVLEIGWNQAAAVQNLLKASGFKEIQVIKDYAGYDRVVSAIRV